MLVCNFQEVTSYHCEPQAYQAVVGSIYGELSICSSDFFPTPLEKDASVRSAIAVLYNWKILQVVAVNMWSLAALHYDSPATVEILADRMKQILREQPEQMTEQASLVYPSPL